MKSSHNPRPGIPVSAENEETTERILLPGPVTGFPEQAWIILEQQWEHSDEFFVPEGEHAHCDLYYSESAAADECRRLNEEFFTTEPPIDYRDEMEGYLDPEIYDPETVTWDQLREAGYPGPYRVLELHTPLRKSPV